MLPVNVWQTAEKARVPDGAPRWEYRPRVKPRSALEYWEGAKGVFDANGDYLRPERIELIERVKRLIDEARDAAARGQHDRHNQAMAKLRAECDSAQRNGWTLPWPRVVDATDPNRPVTYSFISEFLSEWLPAPTRPVDGINQRFPSAAGWPSPERMFGKLVVISEEVDAKLAWLDLLATIEAATLLLTQVRAGDPLVPLLETMRTQAEKDLKDGPFDEFVVALAEQIRKAQAPVVHGAKAVTLLQARQSGDPARIDAARIAYIGEVTKHASAHAWKSAQLKLAPPAESGHIIGDPAYKQDLRFMGGAVKALPGGKVGGYLVRFSTQHDPDLTGDFFTKSTDLGDAAAVRVLYHHGQDAVLGLRVIGKATVRKDTIGAWVEAQLNLADEYEKAIYEMAQAGRLGWSSGSAGHMVQRRQTGKAKEILSWPIVEASLTPSPAEPRARAQAI